MANQYNPHIHGFVSLKHPSSGWLYNGPVGIVLHAGKRVFINADYSMEKPDGVLQVGDGVSKGFDENGNCIYSVPVEWVNSYLTDKEAGEMEMCIAADARLRSYAE